MREKIEVGFQTFVSDGQEEFGAVREISPDGRRLTVYVENVGDTDLVFIGVFRAPQYQEVSLSNWLTHTPPALVAQHLNVDEATIAKWPDDAPGNMPKA